jgi:hypothetical protein
MINDRHQIAFADTAFGPARPTQAAWTPWSYPGSPDGVAWVCSNALVNADLADTDALPILKAARPIRPVMLHNQIVSRMEIGVPRVIVVHTRNINPLSILGRIRPLACNSMLTISIGFSTSLAQLL